MRFNNIENKYTEGVFANKYHKVDDETETAIKAFIEDLNNNVKPNEHIFSNANLASKEMVVPSPHIDFVDFFAFNLTGEYAPKLKFSPHHYQGVIKSVIDEILFDDYVTPANDEMAEEWGGYENGKLIKNIWLSENLRVSIKHSKAKHMIDFLNFQGAIFDTDAFIKWYNAFSNIKGVDIYVDFKNIADELKKDFSTYNDNDIITFIEFNRYIKPSSGNKLLTY